MSTTTDRTTDPQPRADGPVRAALPRLRARWDLARALRLTGAAVAAFVVAQLLFPGHLPILAPLTALLVVEVTLKDIVTSGLQRIASVTAGVLVAVGFSAVVGLSWWSLGILLAVAISLGQVLRLGSHALEVPISAMLVLAVGGASAAATDRIAETLVGAAVGVLVNVAFPPAVRSEEAAAAVHRYARELGMLLSVAAEELRQPITEAQAARWMQSARDLTRQVPGIDQELQDMQHSRRLNPRALAVPDTGRNLRADLDSLEHTTVAVRSMFRSILDGVREDPNPDPAAGAELRRVFSALIAEIGLAVKAFGDLARAEGTAGVDDREATLATALVTLRNARDRVDDLALMEAPSGSGWQLSEPVRQTVQRVLRDLDTERMTRRRVAVPLPLVPPRFAVPARARRWPSVGPQSLAAAPARPEPTAMLTQRLTALRLDPVTGEIVPVHPAAADGRQDQQRPVGSLPHAGV
ncbi:signal transduction histidine kinase [Nakamurella flavida]|uniref:FUSC family protein n=1 Tax=Nakamurella flavida TaxID=363630 RepID=UPI0027848AC5|nr:FUSC family protein [Nakamurella flavida]MDP9777611.1 signal transduction histidine kinase [Nakamurella flavida]